MELAARPLRDAGQDARRAAEDQVGLHLLVRPLGLRLPDPPTAVFAVSGQLALGVYEAVRQRGLRVPDDISVVGFDDLPEVRWCSPPLTTVRQPLAEMGLLAARTVLRLARGERIESRRVELATELVVRDSAAPLPA